MKIEFKTLSPGDLYRTINRTTPIFNDICNITTYIDFEGTVMLVDDQYYSIAIGPTETGTRSMPIGIKLSFSPFKSVEETKKFYEQYKDIFVKIIYNNVIGYANYLSIFPVEK